MGRQDPNQLECHKLPPIVVTPLRIEDSDLAWFFYSIILFLMKVLHCTSTNHTYCTYKSFNSVVSSQDSASSTQASMNQFYITTYRPIP